MKKLIFSIFILSYFFGKSYSQNLTHQWTRGLFSDGQIQPNQLIRDKQGNLIIYGHFMGNADLAPGPAYGPISPPPGVSHLSFICKLNPDGNYMWGRPILYEGCAFISDISNTYMDGSFIITVEAQQGAINFENNSSNWAYVNSEFFTHYFVKLSASGHVIWVKKVDYSNDYVQIDNSGNIYQLGKFETQIDIDPGPNVVNIIPTGVSDAILTKSSPNGDLIWFRRISNSDIVIPRGLNVDSQNNVYITSNYLYGFDLDDGPNQLLIPDPQLTNPSGAVPYNSLLLSKLDSLGNFLWANSFVGTSTGNWMYSYDPTVSVDGSIYITGRCMGEFNLHHNTGITIINPNIFTSGFFGKISNSGDLVWMNYYSHPNDFNWVQLNPPTIDNNGMLILSGTYKPDSTDFDFGSNSVFLQNPNPSPGVPWENLNPFIAKYNTDADLIYAKHYGGYGYVGQVVCDSLNNIVTYGLVLSDSTDFSFGLGTGLIYNQYPTTTFFINITKYSTDNQCAYMSVNIDSIQKGSCIDNAMIYTSVNGGVPSINYQWNTPVPITGDSPYQIIDDGFFTITATDSNNCHAEKTVLIQNPEFNLVNNVDWELYGISLNWYPIPGFLFNYLIHVKNNGCVSEPNSKLQFVIPFGQIFNPLSYSIPPDLIIGDTLYWNLPNLNYDMGDFSIIIDFMVSTSAQIGSIHQFKTAIVNSPLDINLTNNQFINNIMIIGSYDPNYVEVQPTYCPDQYVKTGDDIFYTIHFQNTGNWVAYNIYILDTISLYLDPNTLKILGSSHPVITELVNPGMLKFRFDNIMLPDSTNDEPNSHGYVSFKISQDAQLPNLTNIFNQAFIYFDYNAPVITNNAQIIVIDQIPLNCDLSIDEFNTESFHIFPNPTSASFTLQLTAPGHVGGILHISDMNGRRLASHVITQTNSSISTEALAPGIYALAYERPGKLTWRGKLCVAK